jgi:hypothetical protein
MTTFCSMRYKGCQPALELSWVVYGFIHCGVKRVPLVPALKLIRVVLSVAFIQLHCTYALKGVSPALEFELGCIG